MANTYFEALSERQSRVAVAALDVAQSTELAALQASSSLTRALYALSSPVFLATSFTFELVERQLVLAKHLNDIFADMFVKVPNKAARVAPKAPRVTTAGYVEQAEQAAALSKTIDHATEALDSAADVAARTRVTAADEISQAAARKTTDEAQEIELRAERLVVNKQRVQHGEARVRKEIVTETKSIDVPVSREELVIEQYPVTRDVDVDSAPIADETIRIPLTEEKVNITKATVVRENVEIGKRRVADVEHVSGTVRHEVIRVDDPTTQPATPRLNAEKLVTTADDAAPALITPEQVFARTSGDAAPILVTPAQARARAADDVAPAIITPDQVFAGSADGAAPALVTPAQALAGAADNAAPALVTPADEGQELQLRAERLVVNKQRVQHGKARVRKEIVTDVKSLDVPVSHEEIVIDRHAVTGDVDVDRSPIGDETVRIPLTEEKVNITKGTVVREEVELGKRRFDDAEHISDSVRHEELRVNDLTANHSYEPSF